MIKKSNLVSLCPVSISPVSICRHTLTGGRCYRLPMLCSGSPAVWNSLRYRKLLLIVTLLLCLSLGQRLCSSPGLSLIPFLINTLPGPSASEVTTLWRYTNTFIIIMSAMVGFGVRPRHALVTHCVWPTGAKKP